MLLKDLAKTSLNSYFGRNFHFCSPALAAEVISFDVFDTLIFRTVGKPEKIFDLIVPEDGEFKKVRMQAEHKVRSLSTAEDITLDEIYAVVAEHYGNDRAEELKQREIQQEMQQTYANPEALWFYRYLQGLGKRIVITSDMYLPTEVVERILEKAGYRGYERIYVSGECGLSKRSGNLYRRMIRDCRTKNILHIGDHAVSDYYRAKEAGIRAFLYHREDKIRVFAKNRYEVEQDCKKWAVFADLNSR